MAGILKCDQVQSDSNLAFAIAGSNVAFMNATSLQMVGSNVSLAGTNVITNGKLVTAGMPVGAVLQVVQYAANPGVFSSSSTSYVATSTAATITPTSASSKILIFYNAVLYGNQASCQPVHTVYRGATDLASTNARGLGQIYSASGALQAHGTGILLDSPATTSATTYTVYVKLNLGTLQWGSDGGAQVMILMEIAG